MGLLQILKKKTTLAKKQKSEVFYLRGFQRSGTNWLCNLLNLHPDISCKGEFHLEKLFTARKQIINNSFGFMQDGAQFDPHFFQFIDELVLDICGHNKWCGDRTPTGILDTYVPKRKYILITRDGRDCIVSWVYHCLRRGFFPAPKLRKYKTLFDANPAYFEENKKELLNMQPFIKQLSRQWNNRVKADLNAINLSENGDLDIQYYWVRYEELLTNTDAIRYKIYTFLGLDPTQAKTLTEQTSPGFSRHDVFSHNRIGKAGRWKEYFTEQQHQWFVEEASEALELLDLSFTYQMAE